MLALVKPSRGAIYPKQPLSAATTDAAGMSERPWILLSLRRTGGTSLTSFLQSVSSFEGVQHEPFNPDRQFGWITRGFRETDDLAWLHEQVGTVLASRPNIKHCFDIARPEITRALIVRGHALGYRFLLLTRRDEAARLISLYLAFSTGAWGAKEARRIYPQIAEGRLKAAPIDLSALETQVRTDFYLLGRTLTFLRNRQIPHHWLVFEEIYDSPAVARRKAREIAADLGLSIGEGDPRLAIFGEKQRQNSVEIGHHVGNYDAAVARLRALCEG